MVVHDGTWYWHLFLFLLNPPLKINLIYDWKTVTYGSSGMKSVPKFVQIGKLVSKAERLTHMHRYGHIYYTQEKSTGNYVYLNELHYRVKWRHW
jgi:hypothetical protein